MSNKSLVVLILFLLVLCAGSFGLFYLKVNPELALSRSIFGGAVYNDPNLPSGTNSPFVESTTSQTQDQTQNTTQNTNQSITINQEGGISVTPVGNADETIFDNNSTIATNTTNDVATTNNLVIKSDLKKGSKGTEVKALQTFLIKEGYLTGKADGSYGAMTESAVKKFQIEYKLTTTGAVSGETKSLLNELIAG